MNSRENEGKRRKKKEKEGKGRKKNEKEGREREKGRPYVDTSRLKLRQPATVTDVL